MTAPVDTKPATDRHDSPGVAVAVPSRPTPLPTDSHLRSADNYDVWCIQLRGLIGPDAYKLRDSLETIYSSHLLNALPASLSSLQTSLAVANQSTLPCPDAILEVVRNEILRTAPSTTGVALLAARGNDSPPPSACPACKGMHWLRECDPKKRDEYRAKQSKQRKERAAARLATSTPPALPSSPAPTSPTAALAELLETDGVEAWFSGLAPCPPSPSREITLDRGATHSISRETLTAASMTAPVDTKPATDRHDSPGVAVAVPSRPTPLPTDSHLRSADNYDVWCIQLRGLIGPDAYKLRDSLETIYSSHLLNALPASLSSLQTSLAVANQSTLPCPDAILEVVRNEILRTAPSTTGVALLAARGNDSPPPSACPACKGMHWLRECDPKKRDEYRAKQSKQRKERAAARLATSTPPALPSSPAPTGPTAALAELLETDGVEAWISGLAPCPPAPSREITLDSGATHSMCGNPRLFTSLRPCTPSPVGGLSGKNGLKVTGVGSLSVKLTGGRVVKINRALLVPGITVNLVSTSQLYDLHGVTTTFGKDAILSRNGQVIATGSRLTSNLYRLNGALVDPSAAEGAYALLASGSATIELTTWHRRFAHLSLRSIDALARSKHVTGLKVDGSGRSKTSGSHICNVCHVARSSRLPFPRSDSIASTPLELVHSDVLSINVPSLGGRRYVVTFVDDHTRMLWVEPLARKSDVFEAFVRFKAKVENESGRRIQRFRSDNGGEYMSRTFDDMLAEHGIIRESPPPYSPQSNGVAERVNRSIVEGIVSLLAQAGAPKALWAEALQAFVFVKNRSPHAALSGNVPLAVWRNRPARVDMLRTWGCRAWHTVTNGRSKLDDRAIPLIFVGYDGDTAAYRLFDPVTPQDDPLPGHEVTALIAATSHELDAADDAFSFPTSDPRNHREAMRDLDVERWRAGEAEEFSSLRDEFKVFHTVERSDVPPDAKILGCRFVYRRKKDEHGRVTGHKVRLVAQGFSQRPGVDFRDTFAPVAKFTSIRVLLALAARQKMLIHQADVDKAYLHGSLDEELYMCWGGVERRKKITQPRNMATSNVDSSVYAFLKTVPVLDEAGSGWKGWRLRMERALRTGNVYGHVTGDSSRPSQVEDADLAVQTATAAAQEAWDNDDSRAINYMVSKLPDNIAGQLLDLDARGIWLHLTNRFDLGNKESIQSILAAIRSLKAKSLEAVGPFLDEHEEVLSRAREIDFALVRPTPPNASDEERRQFSTLHYVYSDFILEGLPSDTEWKAWTSVYRQSDSSTYAPREVIDKVRAEYNRRRATAAVSSGGLLLNGNGKSYSSTAAATIGKGTSSASPSGKKQPQQQRPKCKICQEENPRHSVERCWQNPENPNNRLKEGGDGKGKGKEKEKKSKKDDKKDKDGKVVTSPSPPSHLWSTACMMASKAPTDWHLDTTAPREHIVA
ncbi:hypothetical protein Rt10032_c28g6859 [Rhodotorula toruloides]|uniref:Integrase catalytic domain-containing protein n=1 Tax=Rhodotorula toruloides TaxID=5286 RepID=A0A511KR46_RHOTO|nr:hypothetical protein Rt10032_c28g6859 [Rhodotorula toruloides]